ncbi:MAG: hypothetical protein HYR96_11625 [Deltaproteobacteria bacterium]|nr:hypothetical protein [Deltaproteobacteria bacterium]MBI3294951.1 hypothetical protein [Deltaproteobacteria bacterium]
MLRRKRKSRFPAQDRVFYPLQSQGKAYIFDGKSPSNLLRFLSGQNSNSHLYDGSLLSRVNTARKPSVTYMNTLNPKILFALLITLLFALNGCFTGTPSQNQNTGKILEGPQGNGDGYAGMYYQVDPTYQCPPGSLVERPGYQKSILYSSSGSATQFNPCTAQSTPVDAMQVETLNTSILGYGMGIFQKLPAPPKAEPATPFYSTWCQAMDFKYPKMHGFLVKNSFDPRGRPTNFTAEPYDGSFGSLKMDQPIAVQYNLPMPHVFELYGQNFEAFVMYNLLTLLTLKASGAMTVDNVTHPIQCRVLPSSVDKGPEAGGSPPSYGNK